MTVIFWKVAIKRSYIWVNLDSLQFIITVCCLSWTLKQKVAVGLFVSAWIIDGQQTRRGWTWQTQSFAPLREYFSFQKPADALNHIRSLLGHILPWLILSAYWNLLWWPICVAVRQKDTWKFTPALKHYYVTQGCLWLWRSRSETRHFLQNVSHAMCLTTVVVRLLMTTGRQPSHLHASVSIC